MGNALAFLGKETLSACRNMGGMLALALQSILSPFILRVDGQEFVRTLHTSGVAPAFGFLSMLLFTGLALGLGVALALRPLGAVSLAGFSVGYAVFNEAGPLLAGILFAARVAAPNAIGLSLDRMEPESSFDGKTFPRRLSARVLGMALALPLLFVPGILALLAGAALGGIPGEVSLSAFGASLAQNVHSADFLRGLAKATVFGFLTAVPSCHFGLATPADETGPGRAAQTALSVILPGLVMVNFLLTRAFS